jgi:hypothetical protein
MNYLTEYFPRFPRLQAREAYAYASELQAVNGEIAAGITVLPADSWRVARALSTGQVSWLVDQSALGKLWLLARAIGGGAFTRSP